MDISIDSLRLTSSIVSSEANNLITLILTGAFPLSVSHKETS
jgi:hypothetical protein